MKLKTADLDTLEACPDWSAPFEIIRRRNAVYGTSVTNADQKRVLDKLLKLELVEYGKPNNTYRITPAGRALLRTEGET